METLLQMCLQGSAMIAVVLVLRAALHNRLPKAAFLVLWGVVLARLLLPVSIPVPFNAWSLAMHGAQAAGVMPASAETSGQDAGQDALALTTEAAVSGWVEPDEIVRRADAGKARLVPATAYNLNGLARAVDARSFSQGRAHIDRLMMEPRDDGRGGFVNECVLP